MAQHSFPSFLPDGKHFVYLRRSGSRENSGVFIGSIDATPEQQDSKPWILTETPRSMPSFSHLIRVYQCSIS